jgi:hypothetical protein
MTSHYSNPHLLSGGGGNLPKRRQPQIWSKGRIIVLRRTWIWLPFDSSCRPYLTLLYLLQLELPSLPRLT